MDRRERLGDLNEAILAALDGLQSKIWTALPGVIRSFDPTRMTVVVQPTIQCQFTMPDGSRVWKSIPELLDVPVVWPSGGGYSLTFPVTSGDPVLILFSSRCIDAWWDSGAPVNVQSELRMHDLSDGFALLGVRPRPNVLPSISASATQLRNESGDTFVSVQNSNVTITASSVTVNAASEVLMNTPELKVTGEIKARYGTPAEIGLGTFGDTYNTHTHGGVQSGPDDTDMPNQQVP